MSAVSSEVEPWVEASVSLESVGFLRFLAETGGFEPPIRL
jgi:hypothetical protein